MIKTTFFFLKVMKLDYKDLENGDREEGKIAYHGSIWVIS